MIVRTYRQLVLAEQRKSSGVRTPIEYSPCFKLPADESLQEKRKIKRGGKVVAVIGSEVETGKG